MRRWVVGLLLLGACSSGWSGEVEANFLAACGSTSGGDHGTCECVLGEIQGSMSEAEFLEKEQARTLVYDDRVKDAIASC